VNFLHKQFKTFYEARFEVPNLKQFNKFQFYPKFIYFSAHLLNIYPGLPHVRNFEFCFTPFKHFALVKNFCREEIDPFFFVSCPCTQYAVQLLGTILVVVPPLPLWLLRFQFLLYVAIFLPFAPPISDLFL
jgi:hypothetical protein